MTTISKGKSSDIDYVLSKPVFYGSFSDLSLPKNDAKGFMQGKEIFMALVPTYGRSLSKEIFPDQAEYFKSKKQKLLKPFLGILGKKKQEMFIPFFTSWHNLGDLINRLENNKDMKGVVDIGSGFGPNLGELYGINKNVPLVEVDRSYSVILRKLEERLNNGTEVNFHYPEKNFYVLVKPVHSVQNIRKPVEVLSLDSSYFGGGLHSIVDNVGSSEFLDGKLKRFFANGFGVWTYSTLDEIGQIVGGLRNAGVYGGVFDANDKSNLKPINPVLGKFMKKTGGFDVKAYEPEDLEEEVKKYYHKARATPFMEIVDSEKGLQNFLKVLDHRNLDREKIGIPDNPSSFRDEIAEPLLSQKYLTDSQVSAIDLFKGELFVCFEDPKVRLNP